MCLCGCPTIELAVDRSQTQRGRHLGSPAIETHTKPGRDPADFNQILLFLQDGWLDQVELVYFGPDPPPEFPRLEHLEPPTLSR
jgi:hypothetical protein